MWRARLARHALGCSKRNAELKARRLVAERAILVLISGREFCVSPTAATVLDDLGAEKL